MFYIRDVTPEDKMENKMKGMCYFLGISFFSALLLKGPLNIILTLVCLFGTTYSTEITFIPLICIIYIFHRWLLFYIGEEQHNNSTKYILAYYRRVIWLASILLYNTDARSTISLL